jgi:ATP-dependent protease ClpP protease subunit
VKVKVLLRVKVKDAQNREHVRCEVKQSADTGIVRLLGEISWWNNNAESFRAALDTMKQNGVTKLKAYINSPGGSVWDANEIYNLIVAFCPEENRSLEVGALCASAATTVALAFPVKNTRAFQNVTWMKHNPRLAMEGEERDLLSNAKLLKNLKDAYVKRWAKRMNISETVLRNKMDETWWMSQDELTKYNVVSGFIDTDDSLPLDTRQVFNKLRIENVPAVLNKLIGPAANLDPIEEEEEEAPKPTNHETNFKTQMKNFVALLMASMTSIKNHLTNENANEAEVIAALTKFFGEKETKITDLTNSLAEEKKKVKELQDKVSQHNHQMIKALLDVAQNTEKKITAEQRKVYEEQAPTLGFDGLSKILNAVPARTSVKNAIESGIDKDKKKDKEKEEEDREEPTYSEGENGRRIYNSTSGSKSQQQTLARMMIERSKQEKK